MEKIRVYMSKLKNMATYRLGKLKTLVCEHKKRAAIILIVSAMLVSGVLWLFLRTYHDYSVVLSVARNSDTSAKYYFRDDGMICYSKDGISFTNKKQEVVWNQVFGMASPKMSTCGDYISVGDVGANSVYVFNGKGLEGKIALEKPLQDLRISKQGVLAVILSDGDANQINLYNKEGGILASIKATIGSTGYPLTLALSEDGTRLVINYIVIDGGKVHSRIVFYNFSDKETSSEPVGNFEYDQLFPKIEFVENNTVLACGEKGFNTYYFKDVATEKVNQTFDSEIKSVFVTDNRFGIIMKNDQEAKEGETIKKYVTYIYNFSGSKVSSFRFDFDYKQVAVSDTEIILYDDQECVVYTHRGHEKFQYIFDHSIENIFPSNKSGEYILFDAQNIQIIRVK
ncbi:MAG: DUF5711 family protein [Frisingicoccus sp.]|nr:DUF5711 family protein [Frisingicoccus sp.]